MSREVVLLIDRRELLEKARERRLNLQMIEKDYVLGWLLYGFSFIPDLVFNGGTALSKIYFPETWRLSEDLDFSLVRGEFSEVLEKIDEIFSNVREKSGLELRLKSKFTNPVYLQLKIQYQAVLGKNFIKVDVIPDDLVEKPQKREIKRLYSDYLPFRISVESLEEIFSSKLRTVIERKKSRDYFDIWKLTELKFDPEEVRRVFLAKCRMKNVEFGSLEQIFPEGIEEILMPYWERELGRLINPTPDIGEVLKDLRSRLKFLER
jgi:predicted nucleotidyltransferase component of viral defense system